MYDWGPIETHKDEKLLSRGSAEELNSCLRCSSGTSVACLHAFFMQLSKVKALLGFRRVAQ